MTASIPFTRNLSRSWPVLAGTSLGHLCNDLIQSLLIAAYPLFRSHFHLDFAQLGLLTMVYQITASLLQPMVGAYTDRRPMAWALAIGMAFSLSGLLVLAFSPGYATLLMGSALLGMGSSIFHPEASRIARLAAGSGYGMAQSIFQIGGNVGSALGPLLVALVVLPHGQRALAWFVLVAAVAIIVLIAVGGWYRETIRIEPKRPQVISPASTSGRSVPVILGLLLILIFAKYFYLASFSSYFMFYLDARFDFSASDAQFYLFGFLAAVALGTLLGGSLSDRIGTRNVIGLSFWAALPFSLVLPYAGPATTLILAMLAGGVLTSAFSAIVVYAQALMPNRIGMVSGLFFGLAFGMGGIGAGLLGWLADHIGIEAVYRICAWLPALGLVALWLPASGTGADGPVSRRSVRRD